LSRISEIAAEQGTRIDRLQRVAATLRQSAGYRWVGLYAVDVTAGEVRNLVWDGPAAPEYPNFPIAKGLTGSAVAEKKTVNVGEVGADPRGHEATGIGRDRRRGPAADSAADQPRRKRMSANLDAIVWYLRPIAEHLVNGLILSAVIFLGSLLAFRLLFREQRWSASTRHRASLLLFLVLAGTPILTAFRPTPTSDVPRIEQRFPEQTWMEKTQPLPNLDIPKENIRSTHRWRGPTFWLRWIDSPLAIAISWASLVVACLFRLALAVNRLRLLHRSARPLTVSNNLASRRKITIAESSRISSPVAVGLWSPKVLLPSNFVLSAEDRENVLRHEIAHLERLAQTKCSSNQERMSSICPVT